MCCDKLEKEIFKERFKKEDGLYIAFKSSSYDEDYGYAVFEHKIKIKYCPFCGVKHWIRE